MQALRATLVLAIAGLGVAGCDPNPPAPDPIQPVSASFACTDDGEIDWDFAISISGPVDESRTAVFVETDDVQDTDGFAMTVQGEGGGSIAFTTSVPGTPDGEAPGVGEVPFSCAAEADVEVTFCATPEGRPDERPCWACGDASMGDPPADVEDWISCD